MSSSLILSIASLFLIGPALQKITLELTVLNSTVNKYVTINKTDSKGLKHKTALKFSPITSIFFKSNMIECFKNFPEYPDISKIDHKAELEDSDDRQIVFTKIENVKSSIIFASCEKGSGVAVSNKFDSNNIIGNNRILL